METRSQQNLRDERGQAIVEFAIVASMLLVLLLGIAQFGIAFNHYLTLTDAVRTGARQGAVSRSIPNPAAAATTGQRWKASTGERS